MSKMAQVEVLPRQIPLKLPVKVVEVRFECSYVNRSGLEEKKKEVWTFETSTFRSAMFIVKQL